MLRISILLLATLLPVTAAATAQAGKTNTFHDPTYKISFDYPANWSFARADHEISTFHLDARSAPRNASMRAVAAMPENPYPLSTFSGAYVYFSVTPKSSESACAKQAAPPKMSATPKSSRATAKVTIADIPFTNGHDAQREVCIIQLDDVYTTLHRGACYRFDLAINKFCSQVSGAKDLSGKELDQVRSRLEAILSTVRYDPK
jgi:hypothetical protein